jgi:hypothetical protein
LQEISCGGVFGSSSAGAGAARREKKKVPRKRIVKMKALPPLRSGPRNGIIILSLSGSKPDYKEKALTKKI